MQSETELLGAAKELLTILSKDRLGKVLKAMFEYMGEGELGEEVTSILQRHLASIIEKTAVAYTTRFTLSEMQDLLVFYRSPLGKKFTESSADVMVEQQRMILEEATGLRREVEEAVLRTLPVGMCHDVHLNRCSHRKC